MPKSPIIPMNENVSKSMRGNRAKDTKPELLLRLKLRERGLLGYRVNWKGAPGSPDICFTRYRLAIFIHGCFWHRCPYCRFELPKNNRDYWEGKFRKNVERDLEKERDLRRLGWQVMTIWECELKRDPDLIVDAVYRELIARGKE